MYEPSILLPNKASIPLMPIDASAIVGLVDNVVFSAENKDSITLVAGTAVAQDVSGSGFVRADASSSGKYCIGILSEDVAAGISGNVNTTGTIDISDWTAITGTANLSVRTKYYLDTSAGITAGTNYYLSAATAGLLTATAPSTTGQYVVEIGIALSTTELKVQVKSRILL